MLDAVPGVAQRGCQVPGAPPSGDEGLESLKTVMSAAAGYLAPVVLVLRA